MLATSFSSRFAALLCGLPLLLAAASLRAGPSEDALQAGDEAYSAGDEESALTTWINAYNERANAGTATDETCIKLLQKTGAGWLKLERAEAAAHSFRRLYPLCATVYGPKAPETGIAARLLCQSLVLSATDLELAERAGQDALSILTEAGDGYVDERFSAMFDMASLVIVKNDRLEGNKKLIECLEFARTHPKVHRGKVGQVHIVLARIAEFFGRRDDQIRHLQAAMDYTAKGYGKFHARSINASNDLAGVLPLGEKLQLQEEIYSTVKATPAAMRDKNYYMAAAALERALAITILETDSKRSIDLLKMALRDGAKGWGEFSNDLIVINVELAKILLVHKRYDEGIECYQKVLAIRRKKLGNDHESTLETQRALDGLIKEVNKVRR